MAKGEARQKAYEIWQASRGKASLKEIADKLGLPPTKVRKWKSLDKWNAPPDEVERLLEGKVERPIKPKEDNRKKSGAPPGNQNAKGNSGNKTASPPKRNTNALKTGEYQTIWLDQLADDEKALYSNTPIEAIEAMEHEIRKLEIRELRMTKLLKAMKAQYEATQGDEYKGDLLGTTIKTITQRKDDGTQGQFSTHRQVTDKIIELENAITRVQEKKLHAIETRDRMIKSNIALQMQQEKLSREVW